MIFKLFIPFLFAVIGLWCVNSLALSAPAQASSALIQRFDQDPSLEKWAPVAPAAIGVDQGHLTVTIPKYDGGEQQWPRAERQVADLDFSRFNGIELTVENPNNAAQGLDVLVRDGRGVDGYFSTLIEARSKRTVKLRFKDVYNDVDFSDIRQLIIMRTTPEANYVWHVYDVALFCDDPQSVPRAAAETALARAQQAFEQSQGAMDEPARASARQAIDGWQKSIESPNGLRGRLPASRVELSAITADLTRAKAADDAKQHADASLLFWSVAPGQTFRPAEAMLQYRQSAEQLSIQAAKGEYGEALLRLTNVGATNQDVRIVIKGPEGSQLPALTIRRNISVLARDGTLCGDALAPLDSSGVITLPAGETVELWIRADVKHSTWPAGTHRFTLEARDLRRKDAPLTKLPIDVTILNVDLASATPMRAHFWPEISHPRSWIVHGRETAARDNLADYGANVVTFVDTDLPWPKFTADGQIESIDFAHHDKVIGFYRQADPPQTLLYWMAMDTGKDENWKLRAGFEPGSPQWRNALKNWLTAWTRHLAELGVPSTEYIFYVTDEPNREEYDRTVLFAEIAKSVDPKIRIYVNGSHDPGDDAAAVDRMMKLVDIWQPDESWQAPSLRKLLESNPHIERWVYRCSMSRRNYDVNAHDYYRLMAWRSTRDGVTGIAYWTYCATHPGEDPWDETKGEAAGGIMIYPDAANGLIMSARWELVRMALDDARYVDLLRKATPSDDAQRNEIAALLGQRMTEIIENPDQPERVAQWRIDAGRVLETVAK